MLSMVFVVMRSVVAVPWLSMLVLCNVALRFLLFIIFFCYLSLWIILRHLVVTPHHPDLPAMCLIRLFL